MVNTGRHGDITLENKPCQKHGACAKYTVQRESPPLLRNQNGSKYTLLTQNTSDLARNKTPTENTNISYYKYHQIVPEPSSYSRITFGHADGETSFTSYEKYQSLDTLQYLEIPQSQGSRLQSNHSSKGQIFHSLSRSFGTSKLKLVIFCIVIPMLLLCKGCACFCSENLAVSVPSNPYLTQFNETNMAAVSSGQCLTVTESLVEKICEKSKKVTDRGVLLREYRTNFCGLPLDNILSQQEKDSVQCARDYGCARVLNRVQELDEELCKVYHQFLDVLERIDCVDMFPSTGDCDLCKAAYKRWLCSVNNRYYIKGEQMKPCVDFCDAVSESCPFFRPYGETLIGEPGFICKDSHSFADAAASFYGPTGCCFKPCQVFEGTSCPDYTVTSNCTAISNRSSPRHSAPNHILYVLIICWIVNSWFRHITIPWYSSIGLT